jgi:hypothetical protein
VTVIDLGYRPRAWQRECHMQRRRFTVLALHRRAGKTELALRELLDKALRCQLDLPLFFYVAPLLKQAKAIAWARLKQIVAPLVLNGLCEINESELWVRLTRNGAMIRCYGADNPDAMRGVRLDGVVMDEVAQMSPEVWDDVVQPALSDRLGWALFIGTPNGINLFSQLYFGAANKKDWFATVYTVYDTDALNPVEVARLRGEMSEASFAREYLCDFSAAGTDQLISLTDVENATQRHLTVSDYDFAAKIVGVDPARFGDDKSVIVQRQGRYMLPLRPDRNVFHKVDNMALAAHVAEIIRDWHPDAVFIDEGNGGGVIDRLRQLGHDVMGVHFGGKAGRPRYVNKRTEMWFETRDWLTSGGAIPNDMSLKQDLATPTYKFTASQDVYSLESKDEIKKRIGHSPDVGDALALTFAYPVQRDLYRSLGLPIRTGLEPETVLNYNPLDRM